MRKFPWSTILTIIFVIGVVYLQNKDYWDERFSNTDKDNAIVTSENDFEDSAIEPSGNVNVKKLNFDRIKAEEAIKIKIKKEVSELKSVGKIYFSDTDFNNVKTAKVTIQLKDNSTVFYRLNITNEPLYGYVISNVQIIN